MSNQLERGIKALLSGPPTAKSLNGGVVQHLTLDNPQGWLTGDAVSLSTDRAMKISTVSSCVEVRSNSVAVLSAYIMNEQTKERLKNHRLCGLLWGNVNEAMTRFDYEKLMECNKLLKGNAYAWINRERATGYPCELIPLPPDCVTPYTDDNGHLWYVFFHPNTGQLFRMSPADVLHYKEYSEDGIKGISVLRRAALTLNTAQAAQQYESDLYANGARPSGVLSVATDLTHDVTRKDAAGNEYTISMKELIRRDWENTYSGSGNRFRTAVLDLGLQYTPITMNNSDVQFVESNEVRVADICRFFRTPLHLVYAGKQSYDSNEQNALEFVKYTLQADVTQREQEDTAKLLLPSERAAGLRVKREMKVFLRGDTTAQAAWYRTMREISAYSANDILALEDMPPVPGGDSRYASWNYGPLEKFDELSVIRALGRALTRIEAEGGAET